MLGYRDSGMADSEANANPDCLRRRAARRGRRAGWSRSSGAPARRSSSPTATSSDCLPAPRSPAGPRDLPARRSSGPADPDWYPEAGTRGRWRRCTTRSGPGSASWRCTTSSSSSASSRPSPTPGGRTARPQDDRITTSIDISGHAHVRLDALLAHATQIDPNSPFWFGLPRDVATSIHPFDDYVRDFSLVDAPTPELDLFAGVREQAWSGT